jgi:hypothetical protein
MKKNNIRILAFTMTLCVSTILSARASNAADTQQANKVTSNSLISEEQAYDSSDTSSSNLTAEAYMKNVSTIYLFSQFQLNFPSMSFSSDFRMLIPQQNSTTPVRPAESINTKTEVFLCENSVFVKTITYKKNNKNEIGLISC